jgi:hypothetical protein
VAGNGNKGDTISVSVTASDGAASSAAAIDSTTVKDAAPVVAGGSASAQYSDPLSVGSSATDADGDTLTYSAAGLPAGLVISATTGVITGSGSGNAAQAAPGVYAVTVTASDGTKQGAGTVSLTITKEDARSTYTGDMLAFTSGGTASVALRATVQDITALTGDPAYDANPGAITNATVSFSVSPSSGVILTNCTDIPVALLAADAKTGTASCKGAFPSGSGGSQEYQITTTVSGYYTDNTPTQPTVIEVADPTGQFITGGGYLNETKSSGTYAGATSSKMNFGFNVKYNSKGTNPQGHVNIVFRSGGHVYQIKSTSVDTFGTAYRSSTSGACTGPVSASCWGVANWSSKGNLADITNPNAPVSLGGNLTLQMAMTDKGEPGSADSIAVTLFAANSSLLFSSNWDGVQTQEQVLGGGNLAVH